MDYTTEDRRQGCKSWGESKIGRKVIEKTGLFLREEHALAAVGHMFVLLSGAEVHDRALLEDQHIILLE